MSLTLVLERVHVPLVTVTNWVDPIITIKYKSEYISLKHDFLSTVDTE
jgi:hypothetical protein